MIKIDNYSSAAEVYISSDSRSFNFEANVADVPQIKNAFDSAKVVEFTQGKQKITLYSPELRMIQVMGDSTVVLFTAAQLPEDKTEALEHRAAELESQLADAADTIEADSEAIAELAEIVADLLGGKGEA